MKHVPLFAVGDKAQVLISRSWWRCKVITVGEWRDQQGNTHPVYLVQFRNPLPYTLLLRHDNHVAFGVARD